MSNDFDYRAVPYGFVHCFNGGCPLADGCLRHLVARHAPASAVFLTTVNPAAYPKQGEACPHFRGARRIRTAWGLTGAFDAIPHKTAVKLKGDIRRLFSKTTYYRILNKERSLSPAEQEAIARIFEEQGITEAVAYDSYEEAYDWEDRDVAGKESR